MALITCIDCGKSVSDKATACPSCGAPNASAASAPQATSVNRGALPAEGEEACPFSGHVVPGGATVCECGAYYGYKGGILTDQKFRLLLRLVGISIALIFLGYFFDWQLSAIIGAAGFLIFGIVFVFFVLPIRVQGKKWWREM